MLQTTSLSPLGQYTHHHAAQTVTSTEVANELRNRGYEIQVAAHIPVPHIPVHHVPALTKPRAISVAIDVAIGEYGVVHTASHPYRCPSLIDTRCKLPEGTWNAVVSRAVNLANWYLSGVYGLPSWAGLSGLGDAYYGSLADLGGFMDWIQENPEVLTMIGAAFAAAGTALTARRVQELLKANVPKDVLTKADLPAILAALQGQAGPGQGDALAKGARAATMPAWAIPAMIGGGVLVAILMLKK